MLPKSSGSRTSALYERLGRLEERIGTSITRYEKRLEILKGRMATADEESRRGRLLWNQIRATEKVLERPHKSLERDLGLGPYH